MNELLRICAPEVRESSVIEGTRIGKITDVTDCGQVLVVFPDIQGGPVEARLASSVVEGIRRKNSVGREVLLAFENNDPRHPIIIDTLHSFIDEITEEPSSVLEPGKAEEVTIDGKRITFDARDEIVIKCGKASITLTKAGKVLIRGDYVDSRSSGLNRITGGSVQIN